MYRNQRIICTNKKLKAQIKFKDSRDTKNTKNFVKNFELIKFTELL